MTDHGPAPPRRRPWHRWFLAIAIPYGLLLFWFLPATESPDLVNHVLRLDQIATGHIGDNANEPPVAVLNGPG